MVLPGRRQSLLPFLAPKIASYGCSLAPTSGRIPGSFYLPSPVPTCWSGKANWISTYMPSFSTSTYTSANYTTFITRQEIHPHDRYSTAPTSTLSPSRTPYRFGSLATPLA